MPPQTVFGHIGRTYDPRTGLSLGGAVETTDNFSNGRARLGAGTSSLLNGTEYPLERMSWDYPRLISLYRSSWLARAMVDTIPEDMLKNWVQITGEIEPKNISEFERVIRTTFTRNRILKGMKWGRLFGFAGAVILIKGHEKKLDQPLDLDDIPINGYCGLRVFDRWSGITPDTTRLVMDITSPSLGLPEFYNVTSPATTPMGGMTTRVHHSRVVRFPGRELSEWEMQAELYGGVSEIEIAWDAMRMVDNTGWNIAEMMFQANIWVFKTGGNMSMFQSLTSSGIQQRTYNGMRAMRDGMNSQGMAVLDKDGSLESRQLNFAGIAEVWDKMFSLACAAVQTPKSRLLGDTQTGLSSSNEGDQQIYYDTIKAKQVREGDPVLDQLFPIIGMSTWGKLPKDMSHTWKPLFAPTSKEKSDLGKQNTDAILAAFTAGLISERTALQELKQQADETGMWSNVTDEMIAKASDETHAGEMLGTGMVRGDGGEPGEPKPGDPKEPATPSKISPIGMGMVKKSADAAVKYEYGTVQILIDQKSFVALKAREMRERLAGQHLIGPGREEEPHITVKYGLQEVGIRPELESAIANSLPLVLTFGKSMTFPEKDGMCPVYVEVFCDDLITLNKLVGQMAEFKASDHVGYSAHLTLGFVVPEHAAEYVGMDDLDGETYLAREIEIVPVGDKPRVVTPTGRKAA